MTSFEWWTSLSPFPLLALLRGFVQFRERPGLEGCTMLVCPPEPNATPRFIDGFTVPDKLLVWALDSELGTVGEQLGKFSLRSSLRSFPTISAGDWQPTEDVEPLKRFNHSHNDRALQSHDQGLSLRRRYSRAGSMSRHCPGSSIRELLNRKRVVRRFRSWKAKLSTHSIWFWCRSKRSKARRPLKVFWLRLHRRFPCRNRWLRLWRSVNVSSCRYFRWLSCGETGTNYTTELYYSLITYKMTLYASYSV